MGQDARKLIADGCRRNAGRAGRRRAGLASRPARRQSATDSSWPKRPDWKSMKAWRISASLFMTNGP